MAIAFLLVLLVAVLGFVLADLYRRSRRALIVQVPGGLRFESQRFSVQVLRQQQELRVKCGRGVLTLPQTDAAQGSPPAGPVEHTFAVVGIAVLVQNGMQDQQASAQAGHPGPFDIVIRGADGHVLTIPGVNKPVATTFQYFYLQVRNWIDKLEQRLERERVERGRTDEQAAQAQQHAELMAALMAGLLVDRPADAELAAADREALVAAQLAHWRQAAGFEGQHSAHQVDAKGYVQWFVDLAADGRITLHANRRTVHTTLRGATIEPKAGGLELGVRDAYWSEASPELQLFQVLKGGSSDERRAWKERMEILRNSLDKETTG